VGSTLKYTENLRRCLPPILCGLGIKRLLDAPCGDFNWMAQTDLSMLDYYVGIDADLRMIEVARHKQAPNPPRMFMFDCFDLLEGEQIPAPFDAVICRDFLQHLPTKSAVRLLDRLCKFDWLLLTSDGSAEVNSDIEEIGAFRPLNLLAAPFNFAAPDHSIEDAPGSGRILGVWKIASRR